MTDTTVRYVGDPGVATSLPAVLRARAELSPDAPFLTFEEERRTFADALGHAERTAAALSSLGVGRGDRVATLLPNCTEILDLWFGSALLGAVLVPVNTGLKGDGLRYIVEHSESVFVAVDAPLLETLEAAVPTGTGPRHRFVRGETEPPAGYGRLGELLGADHVPAHLPEVRPEDLASILYTSGTTGLPKGVMNCHNSYPVAGYEFAGRYVRVRGDDVLYTSLPLFHINAQSLSTVGSIVSGRPVVIAPRFSASRFFDDLRAHDATVFNYIGAMLTMLYKLPERDDDTKHRVRLTVGGAAPAEIWQPFERRFGLSILEIYGLTESATFCLGSPPDDIRVGKLGRPVSWSEVRIERSDGTEAPRGEPGEIVIRSKRPHTLFLGYYKNEEATAKAMSGGWFHSGDRGRQDPDSYFVFIDRLKDSIRRRGENISSYEIERIVNSHPLIAESAAVGVPSELGEEEVMVVVVPNGGEVDCAELVEFCRERMAEFMVPRYIRLGTELPKTATQRVQKFKLREQGIEGAWDRAAQTGASR